MRAREVGRQRQRLVQRVGVQRLGMALRCRHRLDAGARDVVEYVLRREAPAAGLAMGAQRQRFRVLRAELACISLAQSRRAARILATSMKKFMPIAQKKLKARRKGVDLQPDVHAGAGVFQTIRQRVGQLKVSRRAGLLHVIAGDADRVEARHLWLV